MFLNLVVDGYMVLYCLDGFSADQPNVLILFAFGGFLLRLSFFSVDLIILFAFR